MESNIEKIMKKIDGLYENPKSKNFLMHLIRAYLPKDSASKVMSKPDGKIKFSCVFTNTRLVSVDEILVGINSDEFKNDFLTHLPKYLNGEQESGEPIRKMLAGKVLGLTGINSDTFMSIEGFQALSMWVMNKLFAGEKHITWVMRDINSGVKPPKKEVVNKVVDGGKVEVNKAIKREKQVKSAKVPAVKQTTYNLGDNEALLKLKQQLKN